MIDPTTQPETHEVAEPDDLAEQKERLRRMLLESEEAQLRAYDSIARLADEIGFPLVRSLRIGGSHDAGRG